MGEGRTEKVMCAGDWLFQFKGVGRYSRQIRDIKLRPDEEGVAIPQKAQIPRFQEKSLSLTI